VGVLHAEAHTSSPKRPLAEVDKNAGAHQKNFNEDRPMHLFAINIKCMPMCAGVPSERGVKSIFATYTCVQIDNVLLDRINLSNLK